MGYIDEKLQEGEQVLYRIKRHPVGIMLPIFFIVIAFVFFWPSGFGLVLAVLVGLWLAGELVQRTAEFGVTQKRVLMKSGLFRKTTVDTPLEQIAGIQATQSFLGRKLGYGTVVVRGKDGSSSTFSAVNHPWDFANKVQEQMDIKKKKGTGAP
jgi:uncharacterized membrane protein YdbT with pleckstrin-like domain